MGSRTIVHPASGFLDESPSSLRVSGRKSIQPPGSWTKVHTTSNLWRIASTSHEFQEDVSLNLQILEEHSQGSPGSMKARCQVIPASIVAYLRGQITMLLSCEWLRIKGIVQLMFPPSLFNACRKQHVQEIYSGTKNQLGYLQAPRRTY